VMRVSVVATGIDANQVRSFKAPVVEAEVLASQFEQPTVENENDTIPELTFDENESLGYDESELRVDGSILEEEPSASEDSIQINIAETLVESDGFGSRASYVGLSEPGTPSPEAMARLRAAVEKVPLETKLNNSLQPPVAEVAEKPRFGLNSLINRMTGQQETLGRNEVSAPLTVIDQGFETEKDTNERIDIPAFLRRQAN
jgi:cell division protein FtsZ